MRLLHTRELRFQEFFEADVPRYAILSHRWGQDEVSYQDFLAGAKKDGDGYRKILGACACAMNEMHMFDGVDPRGDFLADALPDPDRQWVMSWDRRDNDWVWVQVGIEWMWIDTCCIDKSSSSELSEAINSMYQWYARAEMCYVHLFDVDTARRGRNDQQVLANPSGSDDCREGISVNNPPQWFTRGWTLQELLAPKSLIFLNKHWELLGPRDAKILSVDLLTGIPRKNLNGVFHAQLSSTSTTEKFGWAALRKTSRNEDEAYCLIGLFDVNMPLLYGEGGEKAFQRLQRKILKFSSDESIFLWDRNWPSSLSKGVLAESISDFARYSGHDSASNGSCSKIPELTRPPYLVTNQGLQFHIPQRLAKKETFLLPINCEYYDQEGSGAFAIWIRRIVYDGDGQWGRVFEHQWSHRLPSLSKTIRRVPNSVGLFVVPINWVWSREDLEKSGSATIYLQMHSSI